MKEKARAWIEGALGSKSLTALDEYQRKLQQWNQKYSLTSVDDDQIFLRLIAPSAWLGKAFSQMKIGKVVDFGSGMGIPGIPMAICDPENQYILAEVGGKKAAFLKACMVDEKVNKNSNIVVLNERIELGLWKDKIDAVVSRGAGSLLEIAKLWEGKISGDGLMEIFKGENLERERIELLSHNPELITEVITVPDWFGNMQLIKIQIDRP